MQAGLGEQDYLFTPYCFVLCLRPLYFTLYLLYGFHRFSAPTFAQNIVLDEKKEKQLD